MDDAIQRIIESAWAVDAANSRRANAQVQDQIVRLDYEHSMGGALDKLRMALDAYRRHMEELP